MPSVKHAKCVQESKMASYNAGAAQTTAQDQYYVTPLAVYTHYNACGARKSILVKQAVNYIQG